MALSHYFVALLFAIIYCSYKCGAEFVPVYMWGTNKMSEHAPALHKISEDSFKDTLLEHLKKDPYIIVFAEHTLSPEDFAQRDQLGEIAFPNILELKNSHTHISYKPYVQNPIGAIKQLNKKITELSIGSLLNSPNVPKENILIIDLNDAKDDEQRFHMLKRHDFDVVSIYKDFLEPHENILAIYTAHHTSWVAPEEVSHKKSRHLLEDNHLDEAAPKFKLFQSDNILMYLKDGGKLHLDNANISLSDFTTDDGASNDTKLVIKNSQAKIEFYFRLEGDGYWSLESVDVSNGKNPNTTVLKVTDVYAPIRFSYHCDDFILTADKNQLTLPGLQVQHFQEKLTKNNITFGDAYDCVGFTSVPIWSALFISAILLLIMTFGLTMMMDIKTMDRFDDPKGKTITINAAE